jgi:stage II sporulation protein P
MRNVQKIKKISRLTEHRSVYYLCILLVSAIFFAVITMTPISNIISSFLKDEFKSAFVKQDKNKFDLGKTLLSLSFPGINNGYDLNDYNVFADINDDLSILETEQKRYNPYENIPLADDDSILTIYDLYEYYRTASGAILSDATPPLLENSEIPQDYYRITPKNYSGQKTKIPKLLIINQTSFYVNLNDYISRKYPISQFDPQKKDEPVVLILDTHTTESYVEDGTEFYSPPFTAERTTDLNKNVALIATELRKKLEEYNIPVIQSTKLHDAVSFKDSYIRSLETMNEYLEKYPSIKYIIDVHRDSLIASDGEKYKPTVKINGRDCSQVMMVVGTDDGGAYHPDWQDNLTFATHLQQKMNDKYPMFARPVNLRNARFNQHTTKGSIILEVGSCGSAFSEALYAAELFGECFAELVLENN